MLFCGSPVSSENSNSESSSSSSGGESSGSKSPLKADNGIENIGLAVFREDKFIGELTPTETLSDLIMSHELKTCRLSITDPDDENKAIDMLLTEDSRPQIKVSILNGMPYVAVKIKMNARISSITQVSDSIPAERISKIEKSASEYLKLQIMNYLYKTAKVFKSDISGIGKHAIKNFKTCTEFNEYNWLDKYENTFFSADVKVNVKSSFLLTGT